MALPQVRTQLINAILHKAGLLLLVLGYSCCIIEPPKSGPGSSSRLLSLRQRGTKSQCQSPVWLSRLLTPKGALCTPDVWATDTKDGGALYTLEVWAVDKLMHTGDKTAYCQTAPIIWHDKPVLLTPQSWRVRFLTLLRVVIQTPKWLTNEQDTCNSLTGGHQQTTHVTPVYT